MKAVRAGMKEYEVEALIEAVLSPPRLGGSIVHFRYRLRRERHRVHYITTWARFRTVICCWWMPGPNTGYASDITRTFSDQRQVHSAQRDIYDLVLETQCPASTWFVRACGSRNLKTHSVEMLTQGMVRLGLLKGDPKKLIEKKEVHAVLHA